MLHISGYLAGYQKEAFGGYGGTVPYYPPAPAEPKPSGPGFWAKARTKAEDYLAERTEEGMKRRYPALANPEIQAFLKDPAELAQMAAAAKKFSPLLKGISAHPMAAGALAMGVPIALGAGMLGQASQMAALRSQMAQMQANPPAYGQYSQNQPPDLYQNFRRARAGAGWSGQPTAARNFGMPGYTPQSFVRA
jgi:hypothetical protein